MKPNTKAVKEHRQRNKEQGFVRKEYKIKPHWHEPITSLIQRLRDK